MRSAPVECEILAALPRHHLREKLIVAWHTPVLRLEVVTNRLGALHADDPFVLHLVDLVQMVVDDLAYEHLTLHHVLYVHLYFAEGNLGRVALLLALREDLLDRVPEEGMLAEALLDPVSGRLVGLKMAENTSYFILFNAILGGEDVLQRHQQVQRRRADDTVHLGPRPAALHGRGEHAGEVVERRVEVFDRVQRRVDEVAGDLRGLGKGALLDELPIGVLQNP
mmetsp:Transcript_25301/g.67668  ORF Transcript_25301/g.67668 Transcript_25301/m.67668 type:complete len:224 (-) Transcript_25301:356-1027(-)